MVGRYANSDSWQSAIRNSGGSYSSGSSAQVGIVPSSNGVKVLAIGAASGACFYGLHTAAIAIKAATTGIAVFAANLFGKVTEHGTKCYTGVIAGTSLTETPKKIEEVLWKERSYTDFLPFSGDGMEPAVITHAKAWQTGLHNLKGPISNEAAQEGLANAFKNENIGTDEESLVSKGFASVNSGVKKLVAAECEDFDGSLSLFKGALIALALLTTAAIAINACKSKLESKRH